MQMNEHVRASLVGALFSRSPITEHRLPTTNHRSPITDYRSPLTDHRLLITALCAVLLALSTTASAGTFSNPSLTKIKNSLASIQQGDAPIDDDGTGTFHGMYKIEVTLDPNYIKGDVSIQIQIQKEAAVEGDPPPDPEIITVAPGTAPDEGPWILTYYWNSRADSADAYQGNLKLKFKLIGNNTTTE